MSVLGKSTAGRGKLIGLLAVVLVIVGYLYFTSGSDQKKVTVYFDEAISVYPGTDVDLMGVSIGKVDSVTPDGGQVKVVISYDSKYKLPAVSNTVNQGARAAVITPTLVADRFVQFNPYSGGPVLADGATVPLYYPDHTPRNAVPVELDQIYSSLGDLTTTLGPSGANKNGALSELLHATATALNGNGALGGQAISNFAKAAQTLGNNSNQIFSTVDNLAGLTTTLQANDKFVGQFMTHLATVSSQLAGESGNLQQALAAVANAVGTVQSFVHNNRAMLKADLQQLTTTLGVLARQKKTLGDVLQYSALGLSNLTDAYDNTTGTIGIRAQLGPMGSDLGNVLCNVLMVNKAPNASQACTLFNALLGGGTNLGAGIPANSA
ncbi:MAG TPA: MCE family protein, partial [Marmoricola sp.]|nr:MCE family protein [Marmoricola sp.]